jgi:hypothetical protein
MILKRVIYELFEFELDDGAHSDASPGEPITLNRQLRLEFADDDPLFITWTSGELPEAAYHVGWSERSFCMGEAEVERDATQTALWQGMVGQKLSMHWRGADKQVIELRSPGATVYCYALYQDRLHLTRRFPDSIAAQDR